MWSGGFWEDGGWGLEVWRANDNEANHAKNRRVEMLVGGIR